MDPGALDQRDLVLLVDRWFDRSKVSLVSASPNASVPLIHEKISINAARPEIAAAQELFAFDDTIATSDLTRRDILRIPRLLAIYHSFANLESSDVIIVSGGYARGLVGRLKNGVPIGVSSFSSGSLLGMLGLCAASSEPLTRSMSDDRNSVLEYFARAIRGEPTEPASPFDGPPAIPSLDHSLSDAIERLDSKHESQTVILSGWIATPGVRQSLSDKACNLVPSSPTFGAEYYGFNSGLLPAMADFRGLLFEARTGVHAHGSPEQRARYERLVDGLMAITDKFNVPQAYVDILDELRRQRLPAGLRERVEAVANLMVWEPDINSELLATEVAKIDPEGIGVTGGLPEALTQGVRIIIRKCLEPCYLHRDSGEVIRKARVSADLVHPMHWRLVDRTKSDAPTLLESQGKFLAEVRAGNHTSETADWPKVMALLDSMRGAPRYFMWVDRM